MPGKKIYKCEFTEKSSETICGRTFKYYVNYHNHLNFHSGAKPWTCKEPGCSKSFAAQSNLIDHVRRHTKTKPYHCPMPGCQKSFYRHNILVRHGGT